MAGATSGLQGRHVVITGGTGALGRGVVETFVAAGAICHVPTRAARARASQAEPPTGVGTVLYVPDVDLASEPDVVAFYAGLPSDLWASIHLAGGFAMGGITETSLGDLRSQLDMNVVTTFLSCREAVRKFRLRPGDGGGRLVNVASRTGLRPAGQKAAYNLAKAAVAALTASLADELKQEGILVNAVAPGTIDTPTNRAAMPEEDARAMVSPAAVASVIAWLASPDNQIASGAVIPVYGNS